MGDYAWGDDVGTDEAGQATVDSFVDSVFGFPKPVQGSATKVVAKDQQQFSSGQVIDMIFPGVAKAQAERRVALLTFGLIAVVLWAVFMKKGD